LIYFNQVLASKSPLVDLVKMGGYKEFENDIIVVDKEGIRKVTGNFSKSTNGDFEANTWLK
jgi:hypothetical protein